MYSFISKLTITSARIERERETERMGSVCEEEISRVYSYVAEHILLTVIIFNVDGWWCSIVDCNLRIRASQDEIERLSVFNNVIINHWNLKQCAIDQRS